MRKLFAILFVFDILRYILLHYRYEEHSGRTDYRIFFVKVLKSVRPELILSKVKN